MPGSVRAVVYNDVVVWVWLCLMVGEWRFGCCWCYLVWGGGGECVELAKLLYRFLLTSSNNGTQGWGTFVG